MLSQAIEGPGISLSAGHHLGSSSEFILCHPPARGANAGDEPGQHPTLCRFERVWLVAKPG